MESKQGKRRLAAILFCDIQGYTALMQEDEADGRLKLAKFRDTLREKVSQFQGQMINDYGDGCLCIFDSAVDALNCAKEAQKVFRNEPMVPVRMGLHSGDVFFEDENVFGDSVNIASRIESLATPGSILFSQSVKRHIDNHKPFEVKPLGLFQLKNVKKPTEVFALANEGLPVPNANSLSGKLKSRNRIWWILTAFLLVGIIAMTQIFSPFKEDTPKAEGADKSVAVLPFDNLNKNPEQDYFSDGISQDILTNLSGIRDLQVISFNSSKQFRGSEKSSKEIGEALGVKHLLSGSVQQSGDQLRIRAMLVNTETEEQLWAKRYDMKMEDVFQIQSEVSNEIAEVLKAELLPQVAARINQKPTDNLAAWQEYSQGRYHWELRTINDLKEAEQHFLRAIELDPNFAMGHAGLAQTYLLFYINRYVDPKAMGERLLFHARQALTLNPETADAHSALGAFYTWSSFDFPKIVSSFEQAIKLEPGNATAHQWFAEAWMCKGDMVQARAEIDIAKRLDPGSRIIKLVDAHILMCEDKYDQAREQLEQLYALYPDISIVALSLMLYYAETGAFDQALSIDYDLEEKELVVYANKKQLDQLKALQTRVLSSPARPNKPRLVHEIESAIILLSGDVERYISRMDTVFFQDEALPWPEIPSGIQIIPPEDFIREHPRFQRMMKERGIYVRPRAEALK